MKFKKTIPLLLFTLLITGCDSTPEAETTTESTTQQTTKTETTTIETTTETTTITEQTTETETTTVAEQINTTPLFEDVFMELYDMVGTATFESIETFVQALDYKSDITKPTETKLGQINVYDDNNNYVYLAFYPDEKNNNTETLVTVNYANDKKEISVSNEFFGSNTQYFTHIIGDDRKNVNNVDDLKTFMFNDN